MKRMCKCISPFRKLKKSDHDYCNFYEANSFYKPLIEPPLGKDNHINSSCLEDLNTLICEKPFTNKIAIIKIKNKTIRYQYYNQLTTCILRIRETTNYINQKKLVKDNECGQAFDFYELVNLISIILGCVETLFDIFDVPLPLEAFKRNSIFKISNQTKLNDFQFFKFVRSASSVHPSKTTSFRGKTKRLNEVFPYAIWVESCNSFLGNHPNNCDLELRAWSSKTRSKTIYYFLCSDEFYQFIQCIINTIKTLVPTLKIIRSKYLRKICFKNFRRETSFSNYSEYLLYLYKRLRKFNRTDDFLDAGLAIASGVFKNPLISEKFKNHLKNRVPRIVEKLKSNPEQVDEVNLFGDLNTLECFERINIRRAIYIDEKFWDYLYKEAKKEILLKKKRFIDSAKIINSPEDDALYVYKLLSEEFSDLFKNNELEIARTFEDLFELTLQAIFFYWKSQII